MGADGIGAASQLSPAARQLLLRQLAAAEGSSVQSAITNTLGIPIQMLVNMGEAQELLAIAPSETRMLSHPQPTAGALTSMMASVMSPTSAAFGEGWAYASPPSATSQQPPGATTTGGGGGSGRGRGNGRTTSSQGGGNGSSSSSLPGAASARGGGGGDKASQQRRSSSSVAPVPLLWLLLDVLGCHGEAELPPPSTISEEPLFGPGSEIQCLVKVSSMIVQMRCLGKELGLQKAFRV